MPFIRNWVCPRFTARHTGLTANARMTNQRTGSLAGAPGWLTCAALALFLSVSGAGCASDNSATKATDTTTSASVDSTFPPFDANFTRYRDTLRVWLQARSMPHRSAADIELNLPFEFKANTDVPYRGRFLLFHGLNDSPYVWRNMAGELAERGYDVRAVLFEGHGSTPKDMLQVQWESWMSSARNHLHAWQRDDIPLHLGGFSMGAVMATWLALDHPEVASLLLISPAYESRLNHYLRWSGIYARYRPWVFGGMIIEDNPIKYNSIPVNSGWQYYQLTRALKRRWGWADRIDIPALLVITENDSVVNHDYTRRLFRKRFVAEQRSMITYSPHKQSSQSSGGVTQAYAAAGDTLKSSDNPFEQKRGSVYPQRRILNQSHLGLMYPPDDPLFGERASVLVCNGNDYPVFMACMRAQGHWYGAQHTPSPDGVPVARTTYNPDWQGVLNTLDKLLSHD